MKTPIWYFFIAATFMPLASHAILEANPISKGQPPATAGAMNSISWPAKSAVRFEIRTTTLTFEHQPLVYQQFFARGLKLQARIFDFDHWHIEREGPYSLNLSNRWSPEVAAYVAWFPTGTFLSSLDEPAWRGYLRGIGGMAGSPRRFEFNDDSQANGQMLQVLGRRTRLLAYEDAANEESPAVAHMQVAVDLQGGILVFGMHGPPRAMLQCRGQFSGLVTGFELFDSP